jgi:hypothetical protein
VGWEENQAIARRWRERFGVEVDFIFDLHAPPDVRERSEGYNERIRQEIGRRHGPGAMSREEDEPREKDRSTERLLLAVTLFSVGIVPFCLLVRHCWRLIRQMKRGGLKASHDIGPHVRGCWVCDLVLGKE